MGYELKVIAVHHHMLFHVQLTGVMNLLKMILMEKLEKNLTKYNLL